MPASRIPFPPSSATDPRWYEWARKVTDYINGQPTVSIFSHTSPNSNVTGDRGNLGINISSAGSVLWAKRSGTTTSDWTPVA